MKAYKIPSQLNIEEFIENVNNIITVFSINPVQDINNDWFISQEEWNYETWKELYSDIINEFEYVDYIPNQKYTINIP